MAGTGEGQRARCDLYRRIFDVAVSLTLAVAVIPLVVVAAFGSAVALRAWPFFVQERVGKDGALFRFIKVRTLPVHVPSYVDKHQLEEQHIPAFCRMLRRFHLDELPQLILVIRGRMSLVGPRPEMAHLHAQMPRSFAQLRTSTRPGCTGLWQIGQGCTDLIQAAPEYDRFYLANRSLRLDLWVLGRTAMNMVGLGRLVALDDVPTWAAREPIPVRTIDLRDASALRAAPSVAAPSLAMESQLTPQ